MHYLMKRTAFALLPAFLLYASPAYAWVGGPWDHNIAGGSSVYNGTFQGVVSGTNVTGIMIFGVGSTSSSSSSSASTTTTNNGSTSSTVSNALGLGSSGNEGRIALFLDGTLVIGQLSATMNTSSKTIAGVFESSRETTVTKITKKNTSVGTNTSSADTQFTFTGVETAAGSFSGILDKTYPDITFAASGKITVTKPNAMNPVTETVISADLSTDGSGSATDGSPSTMYVVSTETVDYDITVTGVKTASTTPSFSSTISTQTSTVQ